MIRLAPDGPIVAVGLNSSGIYICQGLGAVVGGLVLARGIPASSLPFFAAVIVVLALLA